MGICTSKITHLINNGSTTTTRSVSSEFDFRMKNLRSLKQAYQTVIKNVTRLLDSLRDVPVQLSTTGEGYTSVFACLNQGGAGVSESTLPANRNNNNNNNNNVKDVDTEPAHSPYRGGGGGSKTAPSTTPKKATKAEVSAPPQETSHVRTESSKMRTVNRAQAQEDYTSAQALKNTFAEVREVRYPALQKQVQERVLAVYRNLLSQQDAVVKQGAAVQQRFTALQSARSRVTRIERECEKKGQPASLADDYPEATRLAAEADAEFQKQLLVFDTQYEQLLVDTQRQSRVSKDALLDDCEAFLKSVVDPMALA